MSMSSPPKSVVQFLRNTRSIGASAILLTDQPIEGTVVFNGQDRNRGNFFPSKISVSIYETKRIQLLMAKSRIVLNVLISPQAEDEGNVEHYPFELAAWESLEQINALQTPRAA